MRIGLLGKKTMEHDGLDSERITPDSRDETPRGAKVTHRRFLKSFAGAIGLVGVAQLSSPLKQSSAAPSTRVNASPLATGEDEVTIDGTLIVADKVKVGTRTIADGNGCYYA